jgi:hypothetical protein
MQQLNLYNSTAKLDDNQGMYDAFNTFMFSNDRNVFNKLYYKFKLYEMTEHLVGDIVECGVFKGTGLMAWLKILQLNEANSIRKVIGFDFFNPGFVENLEDEIDRVTMEQVFTRTESGDFSQAGIHKKIVNAGFDESRFELVPGDISITSAEYAKSRPGFRISLLYLDLDLDRPTYDTLVNLWDRVVPGGVVVFDEYAYHSWSESNAVDRFMNEKGLYLYKTDIKTPTAYLIK